MAKLPPSLRALHVQLKQAWQALIAKNHLVLSHPTEIELLLSHQFAELIEELRVDHSQRRANLASIFGVRSRKPQGRRYAWVYVTLGNRFWKCESLVDAYSLVNEIKAYRRLRHEVDQWEDKLAEQKAIADQAGEALLN